MNSINLSPAAEKAIHRLLLVESHDYQPLSPDTEYDKLLIEIANKIGLDDLAEEMINTIKSETK